MKLHSTLIAATLLGSLALNTQSWAQTVAEPLFTDGSYEVLASKADIARVDGNLVVRDTMGRRTFLRQADGSYRWTDPNTSITYGLSVVDATTLRTFNTYNGSKAKIRRVGNLSAPINPSTSIPELRDGIYIGDETYIRLKLVENILIVLTEDTLSEYSWRDGMFQYKNLRTDSTFGLHVIDNKTVEVFKVGGRYEKPTHLKWSAPIDVSLESASDRFELRARLEDKQRRTDEAQRLADRRRKEEERQRSDAIMRGLYGVLTGTTPEQQALDEQRRRFINEGVAQAYRDRAASGVTSPSTPSSGYSAANRPSASSTRTGGGSGGSGQGGSSSQSSSSTAAARSGGASGSSAGSGGGDAHLVVSGPSEAELANAEARRLASEEATRRTRESAARSEAANRQMAERDARRAAEAAAFKAKADQELNACLARNNGYCGTAKRD